MTIKLDNLIQNKLFLQQFVYKYQNYIRTIFFNHLKSLQISSKIMKTTNIIF